MTALSRLMLSSLTLLGVACAHRPAPTTAPQTRQEPRFDCIAEVMEVKQEVWQFRLPTYSTNDTVWQGALVISLRLSSPAARAGEIYNLGVFEESEIVVGGRSLARGDAIRFRATEGVLQRWIVPEVFSNLEEVARADEKPNGATTGPSAGNSTPSIPK